MTTEKLSFEITFRIRGNDPVGMVEDLHDSARVVLRWLKGTYKLQSIGAEPAAELLSYNGEVATSWEATATYSGVAQVEP